MFLFYIRHGDPIYNPDSLTPIGHRQAEAVAKRLALFGIDRVFSSTSNRAIETAKPTAELTKHEVELLDFANEHHAFSEFSVQAENGRRCWCFASPKYKRLFLSPEVLALGERWYEHPRLADQRFGEGVARVNREIDGWIATLGYEHDRENHIYLPIAPNEQRIALFAHQGFGLSFLSSLLDIPYPQLCTHFDMGHTGMTVIHFRVEEGAVIPQVYQLSSDAHLYREGLPLHYNNAYRF